MASRDLAKLVVALEAQTGRYEKQLEKANNKLSRFEKNTKKSLGNIKNLFAGLSIGLAIREVARATAAQERAIAQLEQGLKSTGNTVGFTLDQLKKQASDLQNVTIFGDEQFLAAQSQLVTFTKITDEQFTRVTELAADLSTRMDQDLKSSVLQLGKALNDPIKNLSALSRAGIQFSDSQKEAIKALVESGDLISAQNIILKELEVQFGGSARAARDTFSGAMQAVKNAFGDLLEADGLTGAVDGLKELENTLKDPETVQAAKTLTTAIVLGFNAAAKAIAVAVSGLSNFAKLAAENVASNLFGAADLERAKTQLVDLNRELEFLETRIANRGGFASDIEKRELSRLDAEIAKLEALKKALTPTAATAPTAPAAGAPAPVATPEINFEGIAKLSEAQKEGLKVTEQFLTPLEEYEKRVDELSGLLELNAISQETYNRALTKAAEMLRDADPAVEAYNKKLEEGKKVFEETRTPVEALYAEYERLNDLLAEGVISWDTYSRAVQMAAEEFDELKKKTDKTKDDLSTFADQAARNMQSALADFFFEPTKDGLKDLLKNFIQTLGRMAAEIAASKILEGVVGSFAGSGSSGTDKGSIAGTIIGAFAGARAEGGPVDPSRSYLVGEKGPEMFVPNTAGRIVPNNQMMGGATINQYISTPNPSSFRKSTDRIALDMRRQLARGT